MPARKIREKLPMPGGVRLALALVGGLAAWGLLATLIEFPLAVLGGLLVIHLLFVILGWSALWPLDPNQTKGTVSREDIRPSVEEGLVVLMILGSLVGILIVVHLPHSASRSVAAGLILLGVVLTWFSLHLMYAVRYAHLFYAEPEGGIDFNEGEYQPTYRDFLYFSYNLGMTFQVSDTNLTQAKVRQVVLRHCLLSYFFTALILASTINLGVSGLS